MHTQMPPFPGPLLRSGRSELSPRRSGHLKQATHDISRDVSSRSAVFNCVPAGPGATLSAPGHGKMGLDPRLALGVSRGFPEKQNPQGALCARAGVDMCIYNEGGQQVQTLLGQRSSRSTAATDADEASGRLLENSLLLPEAHTPPLRPPPDWMRPTTQQRAVCLLTVH